jgi:hypothetical protein
MHIETIGYIGVNRVDRDEIEDWIEKNELATYDSHEDEIITDVDAKSIELIKGNIISNDDANLLIDKCDVIKFYF